MTPRGRDYGLIASAVAMLLGGIVLLWLLYLVRGVILVVYVSTLLAIGFSPFVHWIERRRVRRTATVPRWAAILLFYVVCVAVAAGLFAIILPPIIDQTNQLIAAWPKYDALLRHMLSRFQFEHAGITWTDLIGQIPSPSVAMTSLFGALETAMGAIGALATILVLPYYLLVEAESLQEGFLRLFAEDRRARIARVTEDVALKVGAWLGSQLLMCVIIAILASIALWIMGVPYFYVLGLVAGLGELVPVIGPLFAAVPAVLTGLTMSTNMGLVVALYFCVQQVFENYVLVPRLMQRRVGVSAVTVIVALLVGTALLGVVGALLAVPTAAIVQVLLHEFLKRDESETS